MKTPKRVVHLAEPTTWHEAVERFMVWLANEERSKYTSDHYSDDLHAFELWWENESPDVPLMPATITEEELRDWKRHLKNDPLKSGDRRMPATVNAKLSAVKSFLGWCHRKKLIALLPEFPKPEKLGTRAVKSLDKSEQGKLLRSLARPRQAPRPPDGDRLHPERTTAFPSSWRCAARMSSSPSGREG